MSTVSEDLRRLIASERDRLHAAEVEKADAKRLWEEAHAAMTAAKVRLGEADELLGSVTAIIDYLENALALVSEQTLSGDSLPPLLVQDIVEAAPSATKSEMDEARRARHEADEAARSRVVEPTPEPVHQHSSKRSKPDPVKAARKAAKAAAQQAKPEQPKRTVKPTYSKDPLSVREMSRSVADRRTRSDVGQKRDNPFNGNHDLSTVTPTDEARVELVYGLIQENDATGGITQLKLTDEIQALMDIHQRGTASGIVSKSLAILAARKHITSTEKIARSAVVRLTTPAERANAGIPSSDDDFAGETTRPVTATARGARITMASSGFETGR